MVERNLCAIILLKCNQQVSILVLLTTKSILDFQYGCFKVRDLQGGSKQE